jgi:hypothetical protein
MRTLCLWLVPFIAVASIACSSSGNKPAGDTTAALPTAEPSRPVPAAPTEAADAAADNKPQQLEGRLSYTELPRRKSVEAYLGVEFRLQTSNGEVVLASSETVTRDALVAAHGKDIKITCTMRAARVPEPYESYPTEMDGRPMKRPDTCVVSALTL